MYINIYVYILIFVLANNVLLLKRPKWYLMYANYYFVKDTTSLFLSIWPSNFMLNRDAYILKYTRYIFVYERLKLLDLILMIGVIRIFRYCAYL